MRKVCVRFLAVALCLAGLAGCGNNEKEFQAAMDKGKAAFVSGTSQEKRQEAIDAFTQAIALQPDSAQARLSRGHAFIKNKICKRPLRTMTRPSPWTPPWPRPIITGPWPASPF